MNEYKLCLVKFMKNGKHYLFKAPADYRIQKGKSCFVEGTADMGVIDAVIDIDEGYDAFKKIRDFVVTMNESRPIKRILKIVSCETLEWPDDSERIPE